MTLRSRMYEGDEDSRLTHMRDYKMKDSYSTIHRNNVNYFIKSNESPNCNIN